MVDPLHTVGLHLKLLLLLRLVQHSKKNSFSNDHAMELQGGREAPAVLCESRAFELAVLVLWASCNDSAKQLMEYFVPVEKSFGTAAM